MPARESSILLPRVQIGFKKQLDTDRKVSLLFMGKFKLYEEIKNDNISVFIC